MSILNDILIQKTVPNELFAIIKTIKLMESLVSVPPLIHNVFPHQKIFDNFENAKTYKDPFQFAQDFRWITIIVHCISDSNFIQIR